MTATEKRRIRLVVSENSPFQRDSFVKGLGVFADIEIVGEARDPSEALDVVSATKPDVVLFDLKYTGWDQAVVYRTLRTMQQASPDTRFLALTAFPEEGANARQAGCDHVMLKESDIGIKQVHAAVVTLGSQPREADTTWTQIGATKMEVEAFVWHLRAGSRKAAAKMRNVTVATQAGQEQSVRSKLSQLEGKSITTMDEAISVAIRHGLVDRRDFQPPADKAKS